MQKVEINIQESQVGKIDNYIKGKGVDLSRERYLQAENIKHVSIERNGLYSLRDHFKPETLDFLYINDIHDTKFYPIILKEMLIYCKVGGFIIIDLNGKGIVDFKTINEESKILVNYKAALRKEDHKKRELVFQKTRKFLEENDKIDCWTFGIISGGQKIDQIDKQIELIRGLKIPKYEIIICGKYKETKDKDIKYIFFSAFDKGWITSQKNQIFENAKYENIVIMHDRIMPNKDFYDGLKKYGNYFEFMSCKVIDSNEIRCGDWMTFGNSFDKPPRIGNLDYKDWDDNIWIDGAFYIIKKSSWKQSQFDESLFWNQGEDRKLAKDLRKGGILARFNPFSSCLTVSWRHGILPDYEFNDKKLGKRNIQKLHQIKEDTKFYIKKIIKK